MRKLVVFALMLTVGFAQAQEIKPTYEREGDLIKVTYFYKDGKVKQQGFLKNKKLTGKWISFDENGARTAIARYKNGRKIGKWFFWTEEGVKEVIYKDNSIASVKTYLNDSKVAVK